MMTVIAGTVTSPLLPRLTGSVFPGKRRDVLLNDAGALFGHVGRYVRKEHTQVIPASTGVQERS